MKLKSLLVITMLIFCQNSLADQNLIAGKWVADQRTKGGLGTVYNFSEDGSVTYSFGALVDYTYQLDSNRILKTSFRDSETGKLQLVSEENYIIEGDQLIINSDNPEKRSVMKRMDLAVAGLNPIVGSWSIKHYTGAQAIMQFTKDGLAQLNVPLKILKGRYKLADQELTIQLQGKPDDIRKVKLEGNHLNLIADANKEEKFTRIVP